MLPLKDSQLGNKSGNLLREKIRTLPLCGRGGSGWPGWYVFPKGVGWDGPRVVGVSEVPRSGVAGLGGGECTQVWQESHCGLPLPGCPAQLGSAAGLGHHALHHVCHLVGLIQCPR